jgi:hypothetical protein
MLDKYRMFWQGKSQRVRKAVEDFLGSDVPVKEVALKHGVSIVAVSNNAKKLKYLYHVDSINLPEILASITQQKNEEAKSIG